MRLFDKVITKEVWVNEFRLSFYNNSITDSNAYHIQLPYNSKEHYNFQKEFAYRLCRIENDIKPYQSIKSVFQYIEENDFSGLEEQYRLERGILSNWKRSIVTFYLDKIYPFLPVV